MQSKCYRLLLILCVMALLATGLFGCGPNPGVGGKVKIGLSFSDFETERWKNEDKLLRSLFEQKGYEVISQEAGHDVRLQNEQIDGMVKQGVKALLVVPEDGEAVVSAVDRAAKAGVKVISYDRLIKSPNIAAYISFNNIEVGHQQAIGLMKALKIDSWDVATKGKLRLMKMGGSHTDNNAVLVRKGQDEILTKYADKIEVVADEWVLNWDATNALKIMESVLEAQQNKIDAVLASNDNTALGALQALRTQGLAGKVPISGQDATADGCNSIAKGELTVTILKDIRKLAPMAVDLTEKLLKGEKVTDLKQYSLAELTGDNAKTGNIYAYFLPIQLVTKENLHNLVVASGFQAYDDVYRDIPADQRPAKP